MSEVQTQMPETPISTGNTIDRRDSDVLSKLATKLNLNEPPAQTTLEKVTTVQPAAETKSETTTTTTETKTETPVAEVKAEPVKVVTKVEPVVMSAEDKSHLEFLDGKDTTATTTTETKPVAEKKYEIDPETKSKLSSYEATLSDPVIKAISEWRKNGGADLNEFIKSAGLVDPSKLTIKDLFSLQAKEVGLEGQDMSDAVDEKISHFESLPKLDQKQIEKQLRDQAKVAQDERLKTFTTANAASEVEYNTITNNAQKQLEEKLSQLPKKWKGYLISDEDRKAIQELAPNYALPIFDESGQKIVDYNVNDAIDFAIWKVADNGRKLLKANYDIGKTQGFEEAMKERTRVSDNTTTTTIIPTSQQTDDIKNAIKGVAEKQNGTLNLRGK